MVDFLHERQQAADFAGREAFAGEPVEVVAGEVGDQRAFMLAEGHGAGDEEEQVFGVH